MIPVHIARLIANFCSLIELADEDIINPDDAAEAIEILQFYLHQLNKDFLRELVNAFALIADEYTGEHEESVRTMASDFFLEEAIAADDPVKLAELEAIRDADDLRDRELNEAIDELPPNTPSVVEPIQPIEELTAWQRLRSWPRSRL